MCLRVSYKKKYENLILFASLQSLPKGVGSGAGSVCHRYIQKVNVLIEEHTKVRKLPYAEPIIFVKLKKYEPFFTVSEDKKFPDPQNARLLQFVAGQILFSV